MTVPLRMPCVAELKYIGRLVGHMECHQNNEGYVQAHILRTFLDSLANLGNVCHLVTPDLLNDVLYNVDGALEVGTQWLKDLANAETSLDPIPVSNMEIAQMREYNGRVSERIHYEHWREPAFVGLPDYWGPDDDPDYGEKYIPQRRLSVSRRKR